VFRDLQARPSLTSGELRILNALPAQRSTANMASSFHVSPNTVKSQLRSIYRKLGVSSRAELAYKLSLTHGALGESMSRAPRAAATAK
jgi:DNA-binding CsgD family transcriptional regulator